MHSILKILTVFILSHRGEYGELVGETELCVCVCVCESVI